MNERGFTEAFIPLKLGVALAIVGTIIIVLTTRNVPTEPKQTATWAILHQVTDTVYMPDCWIREKNGHVTMEVFPDSVTKDSLTRRGWTCEVQSITDSLRPNFHITQ